MAFCVNSSQISLYLSPAWPFTQIQLSSKSSLRVSKSSQRSWFLTGFLSLVRQEFRFQLWIH